MHKKFEKISTLAPFTGHHCPCLDLVQCLFIVPFKKWIAIPSHIYNESKAFKNIMDTFLLASGGGWVISKMENLKYLL
jgi:hypothetical protein